ncbi:MAG TPA: glycosyltransferase family 2 protein [Noviherbaspirillum sp.]|jgi:succinoglycan biosynthesis protein ExoW|uniref:glycosyltransferase family 2 protein n=1 Tax=Noviherbaspirillum sp. TaxID=1926288 RepID=UPI002DDD6DDA|nr:glycosyltransferase family 2 protein [Noviherbaspirillum sp.]HEV2608904.1 glycosyltransferase family 2 protein [Noviherbaspirillum sp.]
MANKIAVVIQFYQKSEGILLKAVRSALGQTGVGEVKIYVVDDASPVPARRELQALIDAYPSAIDIIEQPNAGPAAARNRGLDSIGTEVEYVAFLDSDDEWVDNHLSNAMRALDAGFDFYFSDHFQLNQTVSAFNRAGRIDVARHPRIGDADMLHAYSGDMFDQILMGNIIGTSTVVYRYRKFSDLRFREEFVYAGEDYLFWLELARLTERIAFSSACECKYGPGVNIFSGSGWGTEKSLIRLHHEMKFKKALNKLFRLSDEQARSTEQAVQALRKSFVADVLHRVAHRKPLDIDVLRKQLQVDLQTFAYFPFIAISTVLRRGR